MRERRTQTPLVGRAAEVARALQLARDPATGAVLLTGPTGIGKSHLGESIMAELTAQGWLGVGLSATESTSRIPWAALSELIPATLDQLHGLPAETSGLTILRGLESALGLDQGRSVVLTIEDVASLDQHSCQLVVHLATNRRLFIVASQGADRGLPEALRRLTPASVVEIGVSPLDITATAELAAVVLDGPVGPGLIRNLQARTQGYPLFIRDLLEEARISGTIERQDDMFQLTGDLTISPSLGRQIVFRLGLLSQGERDVLELLALGGEIGADDLTEVIGAESLEAMETRGLIRTWASRRRLRASLAHPLQAEAIEADLSPLVSRRRHRELATLIERHGLRRSDDRVIHALASSSAAITVDLETLVDAAYTALKLDRIEDAARIAGTAFRAEPNEPTRAAMAETMIRQGRFVEADALLAEALEADVDDWDRLRRVIRRSSNQLWGFQDAREAWRIDVECLNELTDPEALERVEAHLAWIEYCDGRSPDAVARTEPLVDSQHPDVRFAVCAARAPALVLCGRVEDGADLAQRGWDQGWGTDTEFGSHGQHLIALGFAKLYAGDLEAARFVAEQAIAVCRDNSEVTPLLFFLDLAAWTDLLAGHLSAALSYFEEAWMVGSELAIASSVRSSLSGAMMCLAQLGQGEAAAATWGRLQEVPVAPGPRDGLDVAAAEAWLAVANADPADGAHQLRRVADGAGQRGLLVLQQLALFDLARLGYASPADAEAAALVAERCQGSLLPLLARAVAAIVAADGSGLDGVAQATTDLGLHLWGAELAAQAADAWSVAGDQRAATASQRTSDNVRSAVADAATPALARRQSVEPLTRREREIAALAGSGAKNSEIADQLHVSIRTVETHLHKIYRKLGVAGRRELADSLGSKLDS